MLKHIVMWKLKETEGSSKQENVLKMKAMLENLPEHIKEIEFFEVGLSYLDTADVSNSNLVLHSEFENEAALKAYAEHPEHLKVVDFAKQVVAERRVVDHLVG